MVNKVLPFFTSSPTVANRPTIRPVRGEDLDGHFLVEIDAADRALLDGENAFPTGSTLTDASCESEKIDAVTVRRPLRPRARHRRIGFLA